jgi:signal transduction histidine kinase
VPTKSESRSRAEPRASIEEPNALPLPDFRLLFESAPGLYLVLSPDLTILAASDAYLSATLTKRAQILGRHLFDVFPDNPDDSAATGVNNLSASLKRVIKDKQSDTMALQKYDIQVPGPEPVAFEERFWSPVNAPVLSADGELLYIIHRVEDVTEFVHLKNQSAKTQAQAERMIKMEADIFLRAQQIQLTNNQLRELQDIHEGNLAELEKATEAAESANRELESFSYSVAHDLRAPLRSLDGFSKALLEDYGDKLDDEGKGDVDLSALSRSIGERLLKAIPERSVSLTVAPELRTHGDARLLTAALENLLGNAVKFTAKQEHARIEVGKKQVDGKTVFFVRDNGAGFDMAYADKLFGAFQRLHSTHEYEGTGIGLATVQRIVSRHGGQIWPEAKPNEGAAFYFTLES